MAAGVDDCCLDLAYTTATAEVAAEVLAGRPRLRVGTLREQLLALRTNPGVQNEHWNAVCSMNDCCIGSSAPVSDSRPSTVTMSRPSASGARTRQPLTGLPSSSTVHAPHIPTPHPSRTPNRRSCSRSTSTSVWWGAAVNAFGAAVDGDVDRDQVGHARGILAVASAAACVCSRSPRKTFSAVAGRSWIRTPVAR